MNDRYAEGRRTAASPCFSLCAKLSEANQLYSTDTHENDIKVQLE